VSVAWVTALDQMRALVAKSATFRLWVGIDPLDPEEDQQTAALLRVWEEIDDATSARPLAIVTTPSADSLDVVRSGSPFPFVPNGRLMVVFEEDLPDRWEKLTGAQKRTGLRNVKSKTGAILDEMTEIAERQGFAWIRAYSNGIFEVSESGRGVDFVVAGFLVNWGLEA